MKNVEFKRNPLFTHQCRLFQDIRYYAENIFVSLGNGIYISYFCAPMTVLKSNISLGTGDKKLMLASRGAGAPWCQKPSARNTHFTWLPGVIPWSSAAHVGLGRWVHVPRARVPKLIASSLHISQGRGADKGKVVTVMLARLWSRGKRKYFDMRFSEHYCVTLSLWFMFIIYHGSKSNRLIIVF